MPIDNEKLSQMIGKLGEKVTKASGKVHDMQMILQNLREIESVDTIDRRTNKKFTPAARQKIHDDNMALAKKALV